MNRFIMLLALVCSTITFAPASAQEQTPNEETQMLLKVVDLLEEYERYASIDEDFANYASSLRALFVDGQASVYNDIIGLANGETMSIKDYVTLMREQSSTTRVEIKNIKKESIVQDGDIWKIVCSFDKYVNLTNRCGIEFASDYFNSSDYNLTATIVYNPQENSCLFEKIEGKADVVRRLPEDYRVFRSESPRDKDVRYNGKPIEFNAMGQAFLESSGSFTYKDPEVSLKVVEDDSQCHLWHLQYKPKPWRVKLHYDMGFGDSYALQANAALNNQKSSGSGFGLDLGYIIPSKSKFKVGIFTGFSISKAELNFNYASADYNYSTTADVDGDLYNRHYKNLVLSQTENITDMNIPLYADFSLHFNRMFSLYVDLGMRFDLNMSRKLSDINGSAYVYGIYPDYGNLLMDEHFGYNGFGNVTFSANNCSDNVGKMSSGINLLAGGGLRFSIPKTPLAIDLGVNYLMGLSNLGNASNDEACSLGNISSSISDGSRHALVYNTIDGKNSTEHVKYLSNGLESMKLKALRFSFGLLLKF